MLGFFDVPLPPMNGPEAVPPEMPQGVLWWLGIYFVGSMLFWAASIGFLIWMLIHCYRYEPDRSFWMWIMILFWPATLAYFVLRWLPQNEVRLPAFFRRWTRRRELDRLEMASLQIGNPYHHVQYGDALRDCRLWNRAGQAYAEALSREPENLQALWGASLVDLEHRDLESAGERLERLLAIDPHYKFGDVSLTYGRVLVATQDFDRARTHLVKHVQRWRQPEGLYLLATMHAEDGDILEARRTLQAMLMDINSCPRQLARRYGVWKSKARKLLRRLPAA